MFAWHSRFDENWLKMKKLYVCVTWRHVNKSDFANKRFISIFSSQRTCFRLSVFLRGISLLHVCTLIVAVQCFLVSLALPFRGSLRLFLSLQSHFFPNVNFKGFTSRLIICSNDSPSTMSQRVYHANNGTFKY